MKQNLLDFDAAGLTAWFAAMGEKPFRAKQVLRWLHRFGEDDFERMSDVARSLRARLAELAEVRVPQVLRDSTATDGVSGVAASGIETPVRRSCPSRCAACSIRLLIDVNPVWPQSATW